MTRRPDLSRRRFMAQAGTGVAAVHVAAVSFASEAANANPLSDEPARTESHGTPPSDHRLADLLGSGNGHEVRLETSTYRSFETAILGEDVSVVGKGGGSILASSQSQGRILDIVAGGVRVRDINLQTTRGTDVLRDGAIAIRHADRATLQNVEASGGSGSAVLVTGNSTRTHLSQLYIHGLTGALANASDVMMYGGASRAIVRDSILGGGRSAGVHAQLNSTDHKVLFNFIGPQAAYGILDYDIAPRATYSLILGNTIDDISGAEPIGGHARGGAGIYLADTGGQVIAHNHVTNTNKVTTDETLAPAGIGINASKAPAPTLLSGNYVHHNRWYGVMVVNGEHVSPVIGNVIFENVKDQLYFKNSDHALAVGNSITARSAPATQERCIAVNVSGSLRTGALIVANRTLGASLAAIDVKNAVQGVIAANNISECSGRGLQLVAAQGQMLSGNVIDVSAGIGIAINLVDVSFSVVSAAILTIGHNARIALATSGNCTGTRIEKSVIVAGKSNPMDFIDNAGSGAIVEQWGTAAPTQLSHQPGDTVWNNRPSARGPIGWKCIAGGSPGRWIPFGAEG